MSRRWVVAIGARFLWMAHAPGRPRLYAVSSVRAAGPTRQEIPNSHAELRGELRDGVSL